MKKFTIISRLMSDDVVYLKDALFNTRYKIIKQGENNYFAHTYGETKTRDIETEVESELASLGVYVVSSEVYWGV